MLVADLPSLLNSSISCKIFIVSIYYYCNQKRNITVFLYFEMTSSKSYCWETIELKLQSWFPVESDPFDKNINSIVLTLTFNQNFIIFISFHYLHQIMIPSKSKHLGRGKALNNYLNN